LKEIEVIREDSDLIKIADLKSAILNNHVHSKVLMILITNNWIYVKVLFLIKLIYF
jgi:hypothetical protein